MKLNGKDQDRFLNLFNASKFLRLGEREFRWLRLNHPKFPKSDRTTGVELWCQHALERFEVNHLGFVTRDEVSKAVSPMSDTE